MRRRRRSENMQRRLLIAQARYDYCVDFILRYHPEREGLRAAP